MKRRELIVGIALAPCLALAPAQFALAIQPSLPSDTQVFGELPDPSTIRRVFAAGGPAAVLLCVLAPDRLAGWPMHLDATARAMLNETVRDLPYFGRLSGRGSTTSSESLLALQPDLVLDAGSVSPLFIETTERLHQQTDLPCILLDGRLRDAPAQLRTLGALLGARARAEELARDAEDTLALATRVLATTPEDERPRVYYARGPNGLETGTRGSINMEVVESAGGRNVAGTSGNGNLVRVSMEQVLAWDPQVILTQDADVLAQMRSDPVWRSVAAVRDARLHLAPSLPFGWLDGPPGVNRLIGLRWLLATLYPGRDPALAEAALAQAVRDFHRRWYGVEPSAAALHALLGTA